ncbi:hypothetical protein OnM2_031062 [Erysiphe neolycopersici]|uniref:Uncharacterized protein n=1 Tax=Erysiphe neolycopersici TaxID=212602 RepID=A0A420HZ31_9PEZI|nr:hypothetical protein OnM2_031062 [Erysiphe neolycopersici]
MEIIIANALPQLQEVCISKYGPSEIFNANETCYFLSSFTSRNH